MQHCRNGVDYHHAVIVVFQSLGTLDTLGNQLRRFNRRKSCSAQVQETELRGAGVQVALSAQQVKTVQEYGLGQFEVDEQDVA